MKTLSTEEIAKSYGGRQVVRGVNLEIEQGEVVGLLGPNGAGKTTSFYMIVGLVPCDAGHIYLGDKDLTFLAVHKRAQLGLGYLPQEPSIFRKMSAEQNILAVLETIKISRKERFERLEELLEEFGIAQVRRTRGDALSGGA